MKLVFAVIMSGVVGVGIAVLAYLPQLESDSAPSGGGLAVAEEARAPAEDLVSSRRNAIVRAAEKVGPAVVSISVIQARVVRRSPRHVFGDEYFDQFFREFFGGREYVERIPSLGSGVIIDPDGLVVTNEHVVRDAEKIQVTLTDGRQFEGEILATETDYDIALLRIDGEDLPAAELGDSDSLIIGEWAIAIGNPFGYLLADTHPTVTAGVISALHRDIKTGSEVVAVYKDMIQTDAAINPGNSGGPLVNSVGQVIGINTFIISQSGGSMGLGFAIPVERLKYILDEIEQYGRIRQIWIGLLVQEMNPLIARSMGLSRATGVIVSRVDEGSPAHRAGLERGDVILAVNGERVPNFNSARRAIFGARVGDRLEFVVLRQGEQKTVTVTVGEVPGE
jgi:serine protease Do